MRSIINFFKQNFLPNPENNFRPKAFETRFILIFAGILFAIKILSVFSFSNFLGANIYNQLAKTDLYTLTNQVRAENSQRALTINPTLEAAAQLKLADMLSNNYFGHYSPQGKSPWYWFARMKYNYQAAGENLAMDFQSSQEVVEAWMNSELHKRNILYKDFTEIGIAIGKGAINGEDKMIVVQMFGKPIAPAKTVLKAGIQAPKKTVVASKKTSGAVRGAIDEGNNSYFFDIFGNFLNFVLIVIAVSLTCLLAFKSLRYPWFAARVFALLVIVAALIFVKDYRLISNHINISQGQAIILNQ